MEVFDILPREFAEEPAENEIIHLDEDGLRGVSGKRPKVVLCTMFKNEAAYLEEWLQYHQRLGISKVKHVSIHGAWCVTFCSGMCVKYAHREPSRVRQRFLLFP